MAGVKNTFNIVCSQFHLIVVFSFSDYVLCPFFRPAPSFACFSCRQINWTLCVKEQSQSNAFIYPDTPLLKVAWSTVQKCICLFDDKSTRISKKNSLVAIFSEGHGGIPWLTAHSCAPRPTKKLIIREKNIYRHIHECGRIKTTLINNLYNHQGGILPAESFPLCASLSRRFATKTGFLIPEGEVRIITRLI